LIRKNNNLFFTYYKILCYFYWIGSSFSQHGLLYEPLHTKTNKQ